MANFNAAVLTAKGIALLAKAQAGQTNIEFTKAASGDGSYEAEEPLLTVEALKAQKQEFPINKVSVVNDATVFVKFLITNQQEAGNLAQGYYVKEVGIFATDPDEGEILYAIATAVENQWDYMPAYNGLLPAAITVEFFAEVSNAAEVTIHSPGAYLLVEDAEAEFAAIRQLIIGCQLPEGLRSGYVRTGQAAGIASGEYATAEGVNTMGCGKYSHAEGYDARASGEASHAEGISTQARGDASHAEGRESLTSALNAHAEGRATQATGEASHAEGDFTKASAVYAHAEGKSTEASKYASHTEGSSTKASAAYAHAEGYESEASGESSHAEGHRTTASNYASHAGGKLNKAMTDGGGYENKLGDAFVIGNGTRAASAGGYDNPSRSNALRVTYAGAAYGLSAFNSTGADYAEFIYPWADNNPENEDRVGYFVTVRDNRLYIAKEGDYIAGITSGNPSVVGNADEDYIWRYERDEFNRIIWIDVPEIVEKRDKNGNLVMDENGRPVMVETGRMIEKGDMKQSKDYDPSLQNSYVERKDRPEWDYVGMLGVLPVRDDGTCLPGRFCKCGKGGIATLAEQRGFDTYMVIERVNDHVVKVILK